MVDFPRVRIQRIDEDRSVPPLPGEHHWLICLELSNTPSEDWLAAFDSEERTRGYRGDVKAIIIRDRIFVRTTLDEFREKRFGRLQREVCHANEAVHEKLRWEQAPTEQRQNLLEHRRRALQYLAHSLHLD